MWARALMALLANTPSFQAAMKAGKRTTISARVWRAKTGRWEDLGTIGHNEFSWSATLRRFWPGKTVIRFCVDGKEVERSNF